MTHWCADMWGSQRSAAAMIGAQVASGRRPATSTQRRIHAHRCTAGDTRRQGDLCLEKDEGQGFDGRMVRQATDGAGKKRSYGRINACTKINVCTKAVGSTETNGGAEANARTEDPLKCYAIRCITSACCERPLNPHGVKLGVGGRGKAHFSAKPENAHKNNMITINRPILKRKTAR